VIDIIEEANEVTSLVKAQSLYRRLGMLLSGRKSDTTPITPTRSVRRAAVYARRILEDRFGESVRLTSLTETAVATKVSGKKSAETGAVSGIRRPTWSMRPFYTVKKPKKTYLFGQPTIHYVVLDPVTKEPVGSFDRLEDALAESQRLLLLRVKRKKGESEDKKMSTFYATLIDEQSGVLENLKRSVRKIEDLIEGYKERRKRHA
jgi:hypothetical protein